MELLNNESIQNYSLEGEVIKGEVRVKNGEIEICVVNFILRDKQSEIQLTEQEIRDLHKEFDLLLSAIDNKKGLGNGDR